MPHLRGFTVIELLVVVAVIAVLSGLLLGGVSLVQQRSRVAATRQTLMELSAAFAQYRQEDGHRRFPAVAPDLGISRTPIPPATIGVLDLLDRKRLWSPQALRTDALGRLCDPWGGPLRYSLTRPDPPAGGDRLATWNWDPLKGRERAYGERYDSASGARIVGPLPFAYLWSLGRTGAADDASSWIFIEDGR